MTLPSPASKRATEMFKGELASFIEQCRVLLNSPAFDGELRQTLMVKAHMLKGGAGFLGFGAVSEHASLIERGIKEKAPDEKILTMIGELIPELQRCLEEIE